MNQSLTYLPPERARHIEDIAKVVRRETGDVFAMLILFGSYARGDWVDDEYYECGVRYTYRSDFDMLLIVNSRKATQRGRCERLHQRIERALAAEGLTLVESPATHIIIHSIDEVNSHIERGRYFWSDIKREGCLLATTGEHLLARVRKLRPKERQQMAREDFKQWFKSAKEFYDNFESNLIKRRNKNAAFQLHQSVERLFSAILLVFTKYKPKTHNLQELERMAASQHPDFLKWFPRATAAETLLYKLLLQAYVDARYKPAYRITKKQLEFLGERVRKLQRLANKLYKQKIESYAD